MTTVETPRQIATTLTANGAVAAGKHTPVDATASNITVTLPSGVTAGSHLSVEKRDSSANTVTISGSIRGASTTVSLSWQYESVTFRYDGTTWTPTEGHKTKAALDAAFSPLATFPIGARQGSETDDTAAIQRAITSAATFGGGRVEGRPGKVYQVNVTNSKTVAFPSGGSASVPYALSLPSNVTVDMRGSTIQLQGSTPGTLILNANASGASRDTNIGLTNVVLDGGNLATTSQTMLQLSFIDGLTLTNVKIINGQYHGGWVFNVTAGQFDLLDADGIAGQAWTFGDPQTGWGGANAVYDSTFGRLLAKNVTYLASPSQPGNPYNFILVRCDITSIHVRNCAAGIKLQEPSSDVTIGTVLLDTVGEATVLNSGMKIQGNPASTPGVDRPTRISIGLVIARNQANIGLYLFHCQDCHVGAYYGYNNTILHTASADVFLGGGINSHVGYIHSRNSNGGGVRVGSDGTYNEVGFRIDTIKVFNPGQNASSAIKQGLRTDAAVTGSFGRVEVIDDQGSHTMDYGFYNSSSTASATFDYYSSTGAVSGAFNNASANVTLPSTQKNNYVATTDPLVTSDSGSGYAVGSSWVNTTTKAAYECLDATSGAAVWRRLTADVQVFSASGTWTKPAWASTVQAALIAPGGGGGAGMRGAANTARVGGGGGGGGGVSERTYTASDLTATVTVTIGAVGAGAAGQTTDSTAGAAGGNGGTCQFGAYLRVGGGSGGGGGGAGTGGTAGTSGNGLIIGANGAAGSGTGGAGTAAPSTSTTGGGGSGGGLSSGNVETVGGVGSATFSYSGTQGSAGAVTGGNGGAGGSTVTATSSPLPGTGGGGGGSSLTTAGGTGGAGANYGGGGGGGGASLNGNTSGAGGNGAPGICVVITR